MKRTTILAFLIMAQTVAADDLTIPKTFQPNTPARAADVNANFSAVEASVDDNAADIAANTASIQSNTIGIANNVTGITTNSSSLASLSQTVESVSQAVTDLTPSPPRTFVGVTTTGANGAYGFFRMNAACQSDFGPDARMATSYEIMMSSSGPLASAAWVQPVVVGVTVVNNAPWLVDVSGYAGNILNCSGWSQTSGQSGLVVTSVGQIISVPCSGTIPIACAVPQ